MKWKMIELEGLWMLTYSKLVLWITNITYSLNKGTCNRRKENMYLCQEIVGNVLWFHLTTIVFIPVVHTRYCQTMSMPWLHTCLFKWWPLSKMLTPPIITLLQTHKATFLMKKTPSFKLMVYFGCDRRFQLQVFGLYWELYLLLCFSTLICTCMWGMSNQLNCVILLCFSFSLTTVFVFHQTPL